MIGQPQSQTQHPIATNELATGSQTPLTISDRAGERSLVCGFTGTVIGYIISMLTMPAVISRNNESTNKYGCNDNSNDCCNPTWVLIHSRYSGAGTVEPMRNLLYIKHKMSWSFGIENISFQLKLQFECTFVGLIRFEQ